MNYVYILQSINHPEQFYDGRSPARVHTRLAFRFRDLSNNIARDYFYAGWEAAGTCLSH